MDLNFIFSLIILVLSIIIHEVSHGYVALMAGDPTAKYQGRLTLNPIKHIDLFGSIIVPLLTYTAGGFIFGWAKPVEINPYNMKNPRKGEFLTAFAGPAANLLLALVFGTIIRMNLNQAFLLSGFGQICLMVVLVNISLAIFNLIPIPPLDGSKIFFFFLPARFNYLRANMERYSMLLVLVLVFFLWQFVTPLIPTVFSMITGLH